MGSSASKKQRKARDAKVLQSMEGTFKALKFSTAEGKTLLRCFNKIDTDYSGQIDLQEFWAYLDVERTTFSERAFSLFDDDHSGCIDFREFVIALYNFCTHNKRSLISFSFDLYDLDGSGEIDYDEAECLVREVWGTGFDTSYQAQQVRSQLAALAGGIIGSITRHKFSEFAMKHLSLLFPAFQLQRAMQKKLGGQSFWERMLRRRYKTFSHEQTLQEFLNQIKESGALAKRRASVQNGEVGFDGLATMEGEQIVDEVPAHKRKARRRSAGTVSPVIGLGAPERPARRNRRHSIDVPSATAVLRMKNLTPTAWAAAAHGKRRRKSVTDALRAHHAEAAGAGSVDGDRYEAEPAQSTSFAVGPPAAVLGGGKFKARKRRGSVGGPRGRAIQLEPIQKSDKKRRGKNGGGKKGKPRRSSMTEFDEQKMTRGGFKNRGKRRASVDVKPRRRRNSLTQEGNQDRPRTPLIKPRPRRSSLGGARPRRFSLTNGRGF